MDEEKIEQAIQYAHDVGFDEGYEVGWEEGYSEGLMHGKDNKDEECLTKLRQKFMNGGPDEARHISNWRERAQEEG